ncbi:hypothetical protein PRIPAC_86555 [Pristionchus pacificus]|uniref:Uncharacterized protein n=1 Tax=Pristionchus pacificus TaxID=54126 RepID=A0A2A6CV34_PRIPA|nr:hypothetical protein PRIPAC_92753 [Pristionchus pacificus]KAF8368726.1 hypothetical protein PRIPAC_86555 [Pristionchus pacificus]|eukprot:PDM66337.1 hypothetical protein PRIPAC_47754 [Pristionchus pacificus]
MRPTALGGGTARAGDVYWFSALDGFLEALVKCQKDFIRRKGGEQVYHKPPSALFLSPSLSRRVERSSSLLLSSSFSLPMTGGERIKFSQMGLLFLSIKIRARILIDERGMENGFILINEETFSSFLILFKRGFISINEFDARIHIDQREADHLMSPEGHRQLSLDWQPPSRDSEVMTSKEQVALEGLRENEELEKNDELEDDEWEKSDDWEKNEEKCPIRYEENPLSLREHDGLFL